MRTMLLVWLASLIIYPTVLSAIGAEPTATGALKGRFLYDGEPPRPAALEIPKTRRTLTDEEFDSGEFKKYGGLGLKDETVLVSKEGGLQNALIWISDKKVPIPPLPPVRRLPAPATLMFHNGKLQPRVLGWWAKQRSLELLNKDESPINLRSDTANGQSFNRLVPGNKSVIFELEAEPRPCLVQSDIFHWVQPAILFPCAHPYFAVTDDEGRFTLRNLPPGEWEFTTWHERAGWLKTKDWLKGKFTLTIGEKEQDLGEVKLAASMFEKK